MSDSRLVKIAEVIREVISRRAAGESLSDESIVAQHPDLQPELRQDLQKLRLIRAAKETHDFAADTLKAPEAIRFFEGGDPDETIGSGHRPTDFTNPHETAELGAPAELSGERLPAVDIPGYHIIRPISSGGQGHVFLAQQIGIRRKVALKVLRYATLSDVARFEREQQILGELKHRHIVGIYDSGNSGGWYYYAMEYIEGHSLTDYLAMKQPTQTERLRLFAKICEAVDYVHRFRNKGIIHRDLKPSNIMIDAAGEPHILDFGLAKATIDLVQTLEATVTPAAQVSDHQPVNLPTRSDPDWSDARTPTDDETKPGMVLGSLPWSSPEQAAGMAHMLDVQSDLYSLGVIGYQMLVGRFPYKVVGSRAEVIETIQRSQPTDPRAYDKSIPTDVARLLMICLEKRPERRYADVGELAADIQHVLRGEPIAGRRAGRLTRARWAASGWIRRNQVAAGLAVILACGLFTYYWLDYAVTMYTPLVQVWARHSISALGPAAGPLHEHVAVIGFHIDEFNELLATGSRLDQRVEPGPPTEKWRLRAVHGLLCKRLAEAGPRVVGFDIAFQTDQPADLLLAEGLRALHERGLRPVVFRNVWNIENVDETTLFSDPTKQRISSILHPWATLAHGYLVEHDIPWRVALWAARTPWPPQPSFAVRLFAQWTDPQAEYGIDLSHHDTLQIFYHERMSNGGMGASRRPTDRLGISGIRTQNTTDGTVLQRGDRVGLQLLMMPPDHELTQALVPYQWALTCSDSELAERVAGKAVIIGEINDKTIPAYAAREPSSQSDVHSNAIDGRDLSGAWTHAVLLNNLIQKTTVLRFVYEESRLMALAAYSAIAGFLIAVAAPWRHALRWLMLAAAAVLILGGSLLAMYAWRQYHPPLSTVICLIMACEAGAFIRRHVAQPPNV